MSPFMQFLGTTFAPLVLIFTVTNLGAMSLQQIVSSARGDMPFAGAAA